MAGVGRFVTDPEAGSYGHIGLEGRGQGGDHGIR